MADAVGSLGAGNVAASEIAANGVTRSAGGGANGRADGLAFRALLDRSEATVAFSGHAARRIEQRGVPMEEDHLRRLESAVDQAQAKGSRDSLILMDDLALVVSITNRTVVTAVDQASQKDHVFTNVDSVVIAP